MKIFFDSFRSLFVVLLVVPPQESRGALSPRTVQTKYGTIRGTIHDMRNTKLQPVEMFLGVPYAAPPVGALRFMPPVTPRPFSKVLLADRHRPVCPQKLIDISDRKEALKEMPLGRYKYLKRLYSYLRDQSEDCLHLNIYLPAAVSTSNLKLPILVIIHGESYEWNSGNAYDGRILASMGDLVVITVNFRLGLLGFFTTLEDHGRSNHGLMDQIAALHWIKENIGKFGGDPEIVTVMGHGTGAVFVDLLMISPLAKGLFKRVMLLSGSALSPRAIIKDPLQYTSSLLKIVGCEHTNTKHIMKCLKSKSLQELMEASIFTEPYRKPFGPIVDGVIIPYEPLKAIYKKDKDSQPSTYEIMIGLTKVEHYFDLSSDEVRFGMDESRRNETIESFLKVLLSEYRSQITAVVLNEYTDWTKSFQHPITYLDSVIEILGDSDVVAPIIKMSNIYSKKYSKTFLFVFTHQTEHGDYSDRLGTIHGEEIPYLLGAPLDPAGLGHFTKNYTQNERMLSKAIMAYFINFIRNGDPNGFMEGSHRTRFNRYEWPRYETSQMKCMALGMKPRVKDHYRAHKLSTWLNLLPKLIGIPEMEWILNTTPESTTKSTTMASSSLLSTISDWMNNEKNNSIRATSKMSPDRDEGARDEFKFNGSLGHTNKNSDSTHIYSTALSVTIAVGCSLLILNIFAFVALYYKKQKADDIKSDDCAYKKQAECSSQNKFGEKQQVIVAPAELQTMFTFEKSSINCDPTISAKPAEDVMINCKRRETKIETAFDREIYETNYTTTFVRPNEINV